MSERKPILKERIYSHLQEFGILDIDRFAEEVGARKTSVKAALSKCLKTHDDLTTVRFGRKRLGSVHVKDQPDRTKPGLVMSYRAGIQRILGFKPNTLSSIPDRVHVLLGLGIADPNSTTGRVVEALQDGVWHVSTDLAESCAGKRWLNMPVVFGKVAGKLSFVGLKLEKRIHTVHRGGKYPKKYRLSPLEIPEEITHKDLLKAELGRLTREKNGQFVGAALKVTKNQAVAQDLVQKVLLRVLEKIEREDLRDLNVDRLKSYIFAAIRNGSINYYTRIFLRDRNNIDFKESEEFLPTPQMPAPDQVLEEKQGSDWTEEVLSELPAFHQEIIRLRILEGLTVEETAVLLGIKEGTVHSRKNRAIYCLREVLARRNKVVAN